MTIGKLSVILGLNSSKFTSGMSKAGKSTKGFGATAAKLGPVLLKAAAGITAVAGAAVAGAVAIGKFTIARAAVIDQDAKFAKRIGETTQRIREIKFAAEEAGVAGQSMATAMQRGTRRIAEAAATGGGPAARALQAMGLNAKELMALKPVDQLLTIRKAMESVGNQGDRMRHAMALWDTEGVAVLQGSFDELTASMGKFRDIAGVISEEDALEMARVTDATNALSTAWNSLKDQIALVFAPTVAWALEGLTKLVVSFKREIMGIPDIVGLDPGAVARSQEVEARKRRQREEEFERTAITFRRRGPSREEAIERSRAKLDALKTEQERIRNIERVPAWKLAPLIAAGSQEAFRMRATHGREDPDMRQQREQTRRLKNIETEIADQEDILNDQLEELRIANENAEKGRVATATFP